MKAENKTQPNQDKVSDYISAITDHSRRADVTELVKIIRDVTGVEPVMWGTAIIGYGTHHYKYATGREGDTVAVGFSSRKQAITIYGLVLYDMSQDNEKLIKQLGTHSRGKGCVYIKSLADIDMSILKQMIAIAFKKNNNV